MIAQSKEIYKRPKYKETKTRSGLWREFEFKDGNRFVEYTSNARIADTPLFGYAQGIDPETGKMATARGLIAVGQRASGVVAIGQFVNGYFALGQFATGRVAAIGQFAIAPLAIGQMCVALAAIGQMGIAGTGIFQAAITYLGGIGQSIISVGSYFH